MTGAMATVTPLCQAPIVAEGFIVVMRRSASARPTSGLAWLSAKTSLTLAPPSEGMPFQPAPRSALPAAAFTPPLIMSAANSAPTLQSWPVPGAEPVSGMMTPTTTSLGVWASSAKTPSATTPMIASTRPSTRPLIAASLQTDLWAA